MKIKNIKKCKDCGTILTEENWASKKNGWKVCRKCRSKRVLHWKHTHPENMQRYYLAHQEHIREKSKDWYLILRNKCLIAIGNFCFLCGKKESEDNHLIIHEKFGKKHPMEHNKAKCEYILAHKKDFIPVCNKCHDITHKIQSRGINLKRLMELERTLKL